MKVAVTARVDPAYNPTTTRDLVLYERHYVGRTSVYQTTISTVKVGEGVK